MNDREMLELAAKAAGKEGGYLFRAGGSKGSGLPYDIQGFQLVGGSMWNPLHDDGDALRLVVKVGLSVHPLPDRCIVRYDNPGGPHSLTSEPLGVNPLAATRRAITRAAAEIGKAMT